MFEYVFAGVLGLLVGSFLNVVAIRVPKRLMWKWEQEARSFLQESSSEGGSLESGSLEHNSSEQTSSSTEPPGVVVKGSHCMQCKRPLSWYENIPVISWSVLGGKCRTCKAPISWQYPLVELAMGVLSVSAVALMGWNINALVLAAFFGVLLTLTVIDFKTQLLPDDIVLPSLWAALGWSVLAPHVGGTAISPSQAIVGAMIGYLALWSIFWLFKLLTGKEGMGYGDFKLLSLMGAFFGAQAILPVVFLASIVGSVIGIVLLKIKKDNQPFAFGPYLALGGIVYAYFGSMITDVLFRT